MCFLISRSRPRPSLNVHMLTLNVATQQHSQLLPITDAVSRAVADSGVTDGTCTLYCLRTTAALTINKNAVSDVVRDVLLAVDKLIPWDAPEYCHVEENSAAHVKACFFGSSKHVIIRDGRLVLGTWRGIYFCEFDGSRRRQVHLQIVSAHP